MSNQQLHDTAVALMTQMRKTKDEGEAAETMKGYAERRKALVEKLKPVLTEIDVAFQRGEQVGGCDGMKEYCKTYKPKGMVTYSRVRQILTGTSGNEGKVKSLDQVGIHVNNVEIGENDGTVHLEFGWCEDVRYTAKVKERRDSSDRTDNAIPLLEDDEFDPEATVEWLHALHHVSGSVSFSVYLPGADEKEILTALIKHTKYMLSAMRLSTDEVANKMKKSYREELERHEEKRQERSERAKRAADIRNKNKKEKVPIKPQKKAKTHATGRGKDGIEGRTRCQKQISEVVTDEQNPTCGLCQRSLGHDAKIEMVDEFDALVAGMKLTKKEENRAWQDFAQSCIGYIRGKADYEWVKDEEQAELVRKNPLHFVRPAVTSVTSEKRSEEA